MVVDSSALIAILQGEPEAGRLSDAIGAADLCLLSAANLLETAIVLDNQVDPRVGRQLDSYVEHAGIRIEPVTEAQVRIARQAYIDFGKGNHPAALNFGHCFAYALAKATRRAAAVQGRRLLQDRRDAGLSGMTAPSTAPPRLARTRRGT